MKLKLSQVNWFQLFPLIILCWGIFSLLFIHIIPVASGFGWDGIEYGKIALNFENLIGKMDSYRAGRIFPSVFIYYILKLLQCPLELKLVLLSFQIYNILILSLSALFYLKISKLCQFGNLAKWFGFCSLFINYTVLNLFFYYPVLTDQTTFFMGILLLYAYVSKKNWVLIVTSILSFFTWPSTIIIGFIIYVYSNFENKYWEHSKYKIKSLLYTLLFISPLIALLLIFPFWGYIKQIIAYIGFHGSYSNSIIPFNYLLFINSLLFLSFFIFVFLYILRNFNYISFFKDHFTKNVIIKYIFSIVIIAFLVVIKSFLIDSNLPTVTLRSYLSIAFMSSIRFPIQFIVCNVMYYGPVIIILMLSFKKFLCYLKKCDFVFLLIFLFAMLFSFNAESRPLINFMPFIVFILIKVIDFEKINNPKSFFLFFIFLSVIFSKIWLPVNLPASVFPQAIWVNLDKFPMQWYFMNFGLFINSFVYIILAVITFFLIILFHFLFSLNNDKSY